MRGWHVACISARDGRRRVARDRVEDAVALATEVNGSQQVRLGDIDPAADGGLMEEEANRRLEALTGELRELQELVYAAGTHGLLIILQGMDAAGKDVTIADVFGAANPQSARVKEFKPPTPDEAQHDFLWRAHLAVPARGELVIFDRSYYEQVLTPRVDGSLSPDALRRRFGHINGFEQLLSNEGIIIVKLFLHVSNEEQERRLRERQDNVETAWKISADDWQKRESWAAYMQAYEVTINGCATEAVPWYVIPADHQWFHNLAVADTLVARLRPYRDAWIEARNRRGETERADAMEAQR
jgi:PPK2 family polyphosphate:nucleotide phosphotransferase